MFSLLLTFVALSCILLCSEYLWRRHRLRGEYGRKFVHIVTGCFVAFWPYYLPVRTIQLLLVAAFFGMLAVKYTRLFHAIHDIKRVTLGEYMYPLGAFIAISLAHHPWIFTTAFLLVAFSDGVAALAGKHWGQKHHSYKLYGCTKTLVGSSAYLLSAVAVVYVGASVGGWQAISGSPVLSFAVVPLVSTLLEAVSPFGLDNITVPLMAVTLLNIAAK